MGDIVEVLRAPLNHSWAVISPEELEMAATEIERLRGETQDWKDAANLHLETETTPRDLRLELGRLHERIEELEKELEYRKTQTASWMNGRHHITDEQIAAAVECVSYRSDRDPFKSIIWKVLNKLNIFQCEHLRASQIHGKLTEPCPDCNDIGAVVRKEQTNADHEKAP